MGKLEGFTLLKRIRLAVETKVDIIFLSAEELGIYETFDLLMLAAPSILFLKCTITLCD